MPNDHDILVCISNVVAEYYDDGYAFNELLERINEILAIRGLDTLIDGED